MKQKRKNSIRYLFLSVSSMLLLFFLAACEPESFVPAESGYATEMISSEISADSKLQVHYIDVGQGDATLIICDGHTMLIDAGNNDKGTVVQSYLQNIGVISLDYVIGTHPDADHIGGLDVVITKFECGRVFLSDDEKDTDTCRDVLYAMEAKGYKKNIPSVGEQYALGSAVFTIVGPSESAEDANDNSIALLLRYGNNSFYFEGDAGEKEELEILNTGIDISADVYKIGHHGSHSSTSDSILKAVSPTYAVISVGENSYGHPHAETLNKLRERDVKLFRTDEQGSIEAVSDGNCITWNCSPTDSWQAGEAEGSSSLSENESDYTKQEDVMVHITSTGSRYHAAGCEYLKDSDITIQLSDAIAEGYKPCTVCHPPQ